MERHASPRVRFLTKRWKARLEQAAAADHSLPAGGKIMDLLIEADPTTNREYLDWICRTYCTKGFLAEDTARVKNTLVLFHRWKRRLPAEERDIGRHRSEQSVWEAVEPFDPSRTEDTDPVGRDKRRAERTRALAESEILDEGDLGGWTIASPQTHFAAQWWGRGTRWCTAMASGHHFDFYASRGRLWAFVDPNGNKFQVHAATGSCADASDRRVDFAEFLQNLPEAVMRMLREDVRAMLEHFSRNDGPVELSTNDLHRAITTVPRTLVDEDTAAAFVEQGLKKVVVLTQDEGWRLCLVTDPLAKWAMGLSVDKSWNWYSVVILQSPDETDIRVRTDSPTAPFAEIARALENAPKAFGEAVASKIAGLWENKNGYRTAAPLSAFISALPFPMPQSAWAIIAQKITKKPRDWMDLQVPLDHIDDEIADILAKGWSLSAIPKDMVTKRRILTFAAARPSIAANEIITHGNGMTLDREIAMAMASSRRGDGLQFVPAVFKDRDFCLEVLEAWPCALKHVPEEFLTHAICCAVMDKSGLLLEDVPYRFRNEELYHRAVAQNGSMLTRVPEEYRTEAVCRAALAVSPDQFVHVRMPLTHADYLRGVSISGSLLARVPLAFRDEEMCRAAITKQHDAFAHVPPSVREMIAATSPDLISRSARLSSRYPKFDLIYTFVPSNNRPDALPPVDLNDSSTLHAGVSECVDALAPAI